MVYFLSCDIFILPIFIYSYIYIYIYMYLKYYYIKLIDIYELDEDKELFFEKKRYIEEYYKDNYFRKYLGEEQEYKLLITNPFIKYNFLISDVYKYLLNYIYNIYILITISYIFIFIYYFSYKNNNIFLSFYISNSNYMYCIILYIFMIFSLNIFKKNIINQKNFEIISVYYIFFILLIYYMLVNNLLTLIFIFEFQSLIMIYFISNSFYLKNNSYLNFRKLNNYPI